MNTSKVGGFRGRRVLLTSMAAIGLLLGGASITSAATKGTTVTTVTTLPTQTSVTTMTTLPTKTATSAAGPVITESSTGGIITFTVSGSTAKTFEIEDVYKSATKYHRFSGSSLTLKGSAGNTIKFRIRATVPKSSWSAWQTATVK